jgi:hypothetical protein
MDKSINKSINNEDSTRITDADNLLYKLIEIT